MTYIINLVKTTEITVVADAENEEELDAKLLRGEYSSKVERVTSADTYLGSKYVSHKACSSPVVTNREEFLAAVGCESIESWERDLFKYTDCGCCGTITDAGVSVSGYAEGSGDAECPDHFLPFPFEMRDYYSALEAADAEGCELWDECHDEEGNELW